MALQDFFRLRKIYSDPHLVISNDPRTGGPSGHFNPGDDPTEGRYGVQGGVAFGDAGLGGETTAVPAPSQQDTTPDNTDDSTDDSDATADNSDDTSGAPSDDGFASPQSPDNAGVSGDNIPAGGIPTGPAGVQRQRQTRDTDALRTLAGSYPNREDYKPSVLRRIGAGFTTYNEGSKAGRAFLDSPYDDALADWGNKIKPAEDLANLERYGNTDVRQGLNQQANQDAKAAETARKTAQGNARIALKQQEVEILRQKQEHLLKRDDVPESEKLRLLDMYKKQEIAARGEIEKAIQETRGTQQQSNITAKGKVDKDLEALRAKDATALAGVKGGEARKTKETESGSAKTTGALPSQQKVAMQNLYGKATREHPEWSKYLKIDADGQVRITSPGSTIPGVGYQISGPEPDMYKQMQDYFGVPSSGATTTSTPNEPSGAGTPNNTSATPSGAGTPVKAAGAGSSRPKGAGSPNKLVTTPSNPTGARKGKIRVVAPDGAKGTWDFSKGPLPKGFKEIS